MCFEIIFEYFFFFFFFSVSPIFFLISNPFPFPLQIWLGQLLTARYGVATFTFAFHMATWTWLLVGQQALYLPNDTKFILPNLVQPVTLAQREGMDIDV